jgi:hypothetical protein
VRVPPDGSQVEVWAPLLREWYQGTAWAAGPMAPGLFHVSSKAHGIAWGLTAEGEGKTWRRCAPSAVREAVELRDGGGLVLPRPVKWEVKEPAAPADELPPFKFSDCYVCGMGVHDDNRGASVEMCDRCSDKVYLSRVPGAAVDLLEVAAATAGTEDAQELARALERVPGAEVLAAPLVGLLAACDAEWSRAVGSVWSEKADELTALRESQLCALVRVLAHVLDAREALEADGGAR